MKQHITIEQLEELTLEQRMKIGRWLFPPSQVLTHEIPLLSIGQIIEYLDEKMPISMIGHQSEWHGGKWYWNGGEIPKELTERSLEDSLKTYQAEELCDALWEAVKETL